MFLDIGVGILLAVGMSWYFQTGLTFFMIFAGIVFALLPDIDFIVEFAKWGSVGGKVIREHREWVHFPLAYIPVVLLVFLIWGLMWALFLGAVLFLHFLHDSVGIGWGIKWFWPFSKRAYKFFSERNGNLSWRHFLVSWDHKELTEVAAERGDPDWIRNIYLRLHPVSVVESAFFVIAVGILYLYWRT